MDIYNRKLQTPHLIGLYIALLTLGVFLEEEISQYSHQLHHGHATTQKRSPEKPSVKEDILTYIYDIRTEKHGESGDHLIIKREPLSSSDSEHKLKLKIEPKYHGNYHPFKRSSELNAYDEMVNLLTMSATHCTLSDSEGKINSNSPKLSYHCAQNNLNGCSSYGDSKNKQKNSNTKCTTNKQLLGYNILPSHLVQVDNLGKIYTINHDREKYEATHEIKKFNIIVDTHYSFVEEFKIMHYSPVLRLDFSLDLTGLNSLHKYEVVVTLLKIIKEVLIRKRYILERSSADSAQLQEYLHQEGLAQPLHILTLWRQYL